MWQCPECGKEGESMTSFTGKPKFKAMLCVLVVFALLIMGGCGLIRPKSEEMASAYYGPRPHNAEQIVRKYMAFKLFDPFSAQYSCNHPCKSWANLLGSIHYGWSIACAINAKNRFGAYVGYKRHNFLIRDGRVVLSNARMECVP